MSTIDRVPKVSAFVISYNREEIIRTCLASLSFVDELILVDKSSTDRTVEFSRDLVDRIHIVPWSPTVEETRSHAATLCSHDWILFLDDDECLNPAAIDFLRRELLSPSADAYYIPRKEHILGLHSPDAYYWPEHHLRCFKRGTVEFLDVVHAGIKVNSSKAFVIPVETGVAIEHFSHANVAQWIEKANRYTSNPDRVRMLDASEDVIAFAHGSIDRWVARSKETRPGGYPASVALLRATYDMIDRLKIWEEENAIDGVANFQAACAGLDAAYRELSSWRARRGPAAIIDERPDGGDQKPAFAAAVRPEAHGGSSGIEPNSGAALSIAVRTNFALAGIVKSLREEASRQRDAARSEADAARSEVDAARAEADAARSEAVMLQRAQDDLRSVVKAQIAELREERSYALRQLDRYARRPWRAFAEYSQYLLLKSMAFAVKPISKDTSQRFARSALKRNPRRFKTLFAEAQNVQAISSFLHPAGGKKNGAQKIAANIFERRILVADHRVPRADLAAGDKVTIGLLRDLCALGFDVTFVSMDMRESPGYDEQLEVLGVRVVNSSSGFKYATHYIDAEGHSFGAYYLIRVDVAEAILPTARLVAPDAKIVFHDPDLAFLRETREAEIKKDSIALAAARKMRDRELEIMRSSDLVALISPEEVQHIRAELPDKPISICQALYAPVVENPPGYAARRNIFFLGGFAHTPNLDAVLWFADKVWPQIHKALPDAEFHIIGAEMPNEIRDLGKIPGVKAVGFVRDLGPVLKQMRVGVAPLLFGAGIKGKVGVTIGAGVPCVCTTIAAEGMGIVDGVHARVADEPGEFANAVIQLYNDEAAWRRMSDNGRALVRERFGEEASRASFYSVLNAARCLPISLFIQHCRNAAPSPLPVHDPALRLDVSIILPVYNKWALTRACLNSILITSADSGVRYEVILADDGSTDETIRAGEIFPGLRIARTPMNLGFLRNCNHAAGFARGRYLLLLNNDTVVLPGWLKALHDTMESDSDIAIGGSKFLFADGTVQEAGGALYSDGRAVNLCRGLARDASIVNIPREVDYISGASIIVRAEFWKTTGGFDERYKTAYCEDADLAMSARAHGKKVWYTPASEVIHFEHQSYADAASNKVRELIDQNREIMHQKWREAFAGGHVPVQEWHVAASNAERRPPRSSIARRAAGKFNILYFTPFASHPATHGNQARIQQFGRRLQSLGHKVHFALLRSNLYGDDAIREMAAAWDAFDLLDNSKTLVSNGKEIPFDDWYEPGLGEQIRVLCAKYDIDIVICSYVFQSKLLEFAPAYVLKVIDAHDKMGGRYDMLRANRQPLEFFSCTPEEEGRYLRRADVVVALREEEARYFDSVTERKSAIVISHVEEPRYVEKTFSGLANVGMVESPNRINLAMVKEFLVTLANQCGGNCPFTVHIAGQVKEMVDALPESEARMFHHPWVRFHGFVPDIGAFYRQMDAIVSPVTMGTGINIKTVQAMAYGMPLVATKWGTKGIETGDSMHNFEDMPSLVRGLLDLERRPGELNDLAKVSRIRYASFCDAANTGIAAMFHHEKLIVPAEAELFFRLNRLSVEAES